MLTKFTIVKNVNKFYLWGGNKATIVRDITDRVSYYVDGRLYNRNFNSKKLISDLAIAKTLIINYFLQINPYLSAGLGHFAGGGGAGDFGAGFENGDNAGGILSNFFSTSSKRGEITIHIGEQNLL